MQIGTCSKPQRPCLAHKPLKRHCGDIEQQNFTGSRFRQKTKAKLLESSSPDYSLITFHYIHQNPLTAGLVKTLDDWDYSSFKDYAGKRNGTLCNKDLAHELLDVNWKNFVDETYRMLDNKKYLSGIY